MKTIAKTILIFDFFKSYPTEDTARKYVESEAWNNSPQHPRCKNKQISSLCSSMMEDYYED